MSLDNGSGGSEDVADFLRRIKDLNEKRDQEDADRTRKLEEEIMQGRKQREARRLGAQPFIMISLLTNMLYRTSQVTVAGEARLSE